MSAWLLTRLTLLALHVGFVLGHVGEVPRVSIVVLAIVLATVAGLLAGARDEARMRGLFAAAALVLAVLHARVVSADAAWQTLQLGLAAAIAASASVSLVAERVAHRAAKDKLLIGVALGGGVGLLVAVPAAHGLPTALVAVGFVGLAIVRPLGAIGAALAAAGINAPRDAMLWWRPETVAPASEAPL